MFYNDGSKYEGEWAEDKRNGIGTTLYANGNFYTGQWSCDKRDGVGRFYDKI